MSTIGVLHAGAMGSALAREWNRAGHSVLLTGEGRSAATIARATATGAMLVDTLEDVVAGSDIVVSVVPPPAAVPLASSIAAASTRRGRASLVVDANAVSPSTCERVRLALAGLDLVDAGISGPPPSDHARATIYASGPRATQLQSLGTDAISVIVVSDRLGDASAAKMSSAAVLKGTTALLVQALATARHYGVLAPVVAELDRLASFGDLRERISLGATKAGRFADEMREIADTQASASLSPGLYQSIADIWTWIDSSSLDTTGSTSTIDSDLPHLIDHLMRGRTDASHHVRSAP